MEAVVKLDKKFIKGTEKVITFKSWDREAGKWTYPKFFVGEHCRMDDELSPDKLYLIEFSASYDKLKETKEDLLRARLTLKSVTPYTGSPVADQYLGFEFMRGEVLDIKSWNLTRSPINMPWKKYNSNIYRIKVKRGNYWTYLWCFNKELLPDTSVDKEITVCVNLFNKRHYDEQDASIDTSEANTYLDKNGETQSRWYTELKIVSGK